MLDFVRGWKRKVGVVTLVVACVLMAAWLRSIYRPRQFDLTVSTFIWSQDGSLEFWHEYIPEGVVWRGPPDVEMSWRVPYRHFVLPLTLLSAYLILSKPPATKPQAASQRDLGESHV